MLVNAAFLNRPYDMAMADRLKTVAKQVFVNILFLQVCQVKTARVCEEVPETKCRLVGFTDCKLEFGQQSYNATLVDNSGSYHPFQCKNVSRQVTKRSEF